jgi:hypothetical protein
MIGCGIDRGCGRTTTVIPGLLPITLNQIADDD